MSDSKEIDKQQQSELDNLNRATQEDQGFQKLLKFKKGDYWCDNEEVPVGTEFVAYPAGLTKLWAHFENRQLVERKVYRSARGENPPERDELPNNDPETWPKDPTGKPQDPWVLQYLLPMMNTRNDEAVIFIGSSFGAKRAVGELMTQYVTRAKKTGTTSPPIIKLQVTTFPTKNWGDVKRPLFVIQGWEGAALPAEQIDIERVDSKAQFDDEIPF